MKLMEESGFYTHYNDETNHFMSAYLVSYTTDLINSSDNMFSLFSRSLSFYLCFSLSHASDVDINRLASL